MKDDKKIVEVKDVYTLDELLDIYKQQYEATHALIGYRYRPPERRGELMMSERGKYDNKY